MVNTLRLQSLLAGIYMKSSGHNVAIWLLFADFYADFEFIQNGVC